LHEVYDDLTDLCIDHSDVRYWNILLLAKDAVASAPVCPTHGHPHVHRLIDFHRSRKLGWTRKLLRYEHFSFLDIMIAGLKDGHIVEPWDI
jgi:hypothetical protein